MLVSTGNYLILLTLLVSVSSQILNNKIRTKRFIFCTITSSMFIALALLLFNTNPLICQLLITLCHILTLKISLDNMSVKAAAYICVFINLLNAVISYTLTSVFDYTKHGLKILEVAINLVFLVLFALLCYSPKIKISMITILSSTSRTVKFIILLLLSLCIVNIALVSDIQHYVKTDGLLFVVKTISLSTVLIIGIIAPIVIIISTSNSHLKNLTANYENQLAAQAEHYSALSKANFELRRFRHDLTNIKIGVVQLINEGKHTEAISMLDSANTDIYSTTNSLLKFDTGNGIVDALLADKQQKAASSNIKIVFEGAVVTENITATELCVIFGNTIDNAIEACKKIDIEIEKIINIICKCNSGFLFLNMSNPVREPIIIKNNLPATTKDEKSLHGFGLYSLDKVIKKHHGELNLSCSDSTFCLDLSVCL